MYCRLVHCDNSSLLLFLTCAQFWLSTFLVESFVDTTRTRRCCA